MIEPLAIEGYVSPKVAKLGKDNISYRSSFANTVITLILCFFILIVPNFFGSDIDFSAAVGFSSFFTVVIYVAVILTVFKLFYLKYIKLKV